MQELRASPGLFTDAAAERYQCDNRSQAPSIANQANSDSEFKDVVTLNSNLVWKAFMRNGLLHLISQLHRQL
ncbi:conjugal transfer protein TraH [Aeromonas hydrophila]|uniref:Conjugal transfer protein TraH n=1 Tax=Aeromonas hydrophila TaxID=644 RepID=A0A926FNQ1_AERHY|nr:conjugal transfer protein TraH [Aeromonas hydrophila]